MMQAAIMISVKGKLQGIGVVKLKNIDVSVFLKEGE